MKNFRIGKKLFVTFGVVLAFFIATVFISVYSLTSTANNFTAFYQTPFEVTNKSADLRANIQEFAKFIGYSTMESDAGKTAEYIQNATDVLQELRDGTAFIREHFPDANAVIDKYDTLMKGVIEERDQVLELAAANRNEEAVRLYFDEVMPVFSQANDLLLEIDALAQKQAQGYYGTSMTQKNTVLIVMVFVSALTLIATVGLGAYVTKSLTLPISEIEKAAKEMAGGALNVSIGYQSRDEMGSLAESMRVLCNGINKIVEDIGHNLAGLANGNFHIKSQCLENYIGDYVPILTSMRMIRDNLNKTLTQINQSADQVASGSEQVSSGAQALSQGATEQASSVEELAATINEISNQVRETAENAKEARDQSAQTGGQITTCNSQMEEMITAMEEISRRSAEIGKIIKTIEDIAFQTNILALNAAVEAARAGTAGKGFAVVADEVRNLASKSAEASKNTSVLIEGTVNAVEKGTRIANETAQSLLQVVEGARQTEETVDKIADAAGKQAASIVQVTQGVDQISNVVQTNSATAEESAAASEELSGQSQVLKSLVGQFKLLDD